MNQAQAKDSSEDCWQILGLSDNADKRAVKSAYAKRLKKTRPDDDPEGFQRLHAAYKRASQLAKKSAPRPAIDTETLIGHTDQTPSAESTERPIDVNKASITQTTRIFPASTILAPSNAESITRQPTPSTFTDDLRAQHDNNASASETNPLSSTTTNLTAHANPSQHDPNNGQNHNEASLTPPASLAQHDKPHYHTHLFDEP
ncbi:MAG: hypothetical protein ACWA5U_04375, partial [bacterium]